MVYSVVYSGLVKVHNILFYHVYIAETVVNRGMCLWLVVKYGFLFSGQKCEDETVRLVVGMWEKIGANDWCFTDDAIERVCEVVMHENQHMNRWWSLSRQDRLLNQGPPLL